MSAELVMKAPNTWAVETLESLTAESGLFKDGDWVESKDQNPSGEVRLIQLADIGDGNFIDKSSRFLTKGKAIELRCTFLEKGDLLVARMPDPLGRACIFPLEGKHKYVTVVDICIVRVSPKKIDTKYLMYLLNSPDIRAKIDSLKSGSTRKRISRGNLSVIELPIASLEEQKHIVAKIEELFSELDNGIKSLKIAREQLKTYRQSLLKHAFEGKLTEQWRKENADKLETPEQLLARIQQEREAHYQQQLEEWKQAVKKWKSNGKEGKKPGKPNKLPAVSFLSMDELESLPELPLGWCWLKAKFLCDVVRGGSPRPAGDARYYDGDIPFLKVADLTRTDGCYVNSHTYTIKPAGLQKTRLVGPNTLLISNSGATLGVPKICLIDATFNDGIAAFLGLSNDELLYHYYFWSSKTAELRAINQGAAQPNLNTDLIKEVTIPVCSLEEMSATTKEIEKSLSVCDHFLDETDEGLRKSEILRQSILKKAFSGILLGDSKKSEII